MNDTYARNLDLNLLRVFAVVAETGSVTQSADRLYLTQPAISAALRRLTVAIGAPLFARQGRGLVLTARGQRLRAEVTLHLRALVDAALAPAQFDPRTSERTLRLGLSDSAEVWLLPPLLRLLGERAPRMTVVAVPVQFRTVGKALASGEIDAAVTVADELPAGVRRRTLFTGGFVCLYDPRHARLRTPLRKDDYFARDHVVVSYNADLRGIVEDAFPRRQRVVRCSVSSFANLGAIVDGSALLATIPQTIAEQIRAVRPHLRAAKLPFPLPRGSVELLWPGAADDDGPGRFLREAIVRIADDRSLRAWGPGAP
jgi:LysR family transcriptional activator of mexEF-oprN operon